MCCFLAFVAEDGVGEDIERCQYEVDGRGLHVALVAVVEVCEEGQVVDQRPPNKLPQSASIVSR